METITVDELLEKLGVTPAELAGLLAYEIRRHGFDKLDEPTQIEWLHDELKARLKKPLRSL